MNDAIQYAYIAAAVLFIIGLKLLSSPARARRGNLLSGVGMLLAIVATLLDRAVIDYRWLALGLAVGTVAGLVLAYRVAMTAMPQMVGALNGFGGLASLLVGWAEYHANRGAEPRVLAATALAVLIGGVTFTGSMVAYAKLDELISGKPRLFAGQRALNGLLLVAAVGGGIVFCVATRGSTLAPAQYPTLLALVAIALVLGVLAVIPIGGADMPVVIALLNSYSGLAGCAAGFIIDNTVLIVAGALVGASGVILSGIMCRAMNRSLANVLFSGFGAGAGASVAAAGGARGEVRPLSADDAYLLLEAARSFIIVPGYGLAVAQAQHAVRELSDLLAANGAEVRFVIHPVAGRMPGHMNILLAEANVPYEQLVEPQVVNPAMETVDVAIVVGANDVVNPAARDDASSPIYGMPIIEVDRARTVIVLKRSMAAGFAGIENPLFLKPNTRMLFGDAKQSLSALVSAFKSA